MPDPISPRAAILAAVLALIPTPAMAGSVKGYILNSRGVVQWRDLTSNENVVEQNEKPNGEIWTTISPAGETYGSEGRTPISVDRDPPPPPLTMGHQVRMDLVIGDVERSRTRGRIRIRQGPGVRFGRALVAATLTPVELAWSEGDSLDDGSHVDEYWAPNQVWVYRLDPSEASWVVSGTPSVVTTGDLVAQLVSVTSNDVTVRIVANPTTTTEDDIFVRGIAIAIQPTVQELHLYAGFQGTCGLWVNGTLLAYTTNSQLRFHLVDVLSPASVTLPITPTRPLGQIALAILLLGSGVVMIRRARMARGPICLP